VLRSLGLVVGGGRWTALSSLMRCGRAALWRWPLLCSGAGTVGVPSTLCGRGWWARWPAGAERRWRAGAMASRCTAPSASSLASTSTSSCGSSGGSLTSTSDSAVPAPTICGAAAGCNGPTGSRASVAASTPLPDDLHRRLRRIGVARTHRLPATVDGYLADYFEQYATEVRIYRQAVVASRALRAVGQEPGDEPISGRPKERRPRRRRDDGIPRAAPRVEGAVSARRRRRGAARHARRAKKPLAEDFGGLLTRTCFAVARVAARHEAVMQAGRVKVAAVNNEQCFVIHASRTPCVTWVATVDGEPLFLCSCSGRPESEEFVVQMKLRKSSTCKHAASLRIAHKTLAAELAFEGLRALYATRPAMARAQVAMSVEPAAYHVAALTSEDALYAAVVDSVWAVVEKPGENAVSQAVFCHYPPCRSRSRRCGHALTVNPLQENRDSGDELIQDMEDAEELAAAELAARTACAPFQDDDVPCRSRNLLPFSEEVRQ